MDRYEKSAEFLMRRGNEIIAERKRRKAFILRSCAIGAGVAAVLGVGLTTYALRPPKKPTPSQSGIIVETETTSAETTVAPTSPSTTATQTTSTKQVTTTTVSTTATTSSSRKAVTTVRTTTVAARTTRTAVTTTAAVHTTTTSKQTTAMAATQTQAATSVCQTGVSQTLATDIPVETTTGIWKRVFYGEEKKLYSICSKEHETITVATEDIGEFYDDAQMEINVLEPITGLPISSTEKTCKLYNYKDFSPVFACVVVEDENTVPELYYSGATFSTLGELIDGTHFDDKLVITEAYDKVINPEYRLNTAPTMEELMNALSDTNLKSLNTSELHDKCSYSLTAEMPELGLMGKVVLLKDPFRPQSGYISIQILGSKCTYDVGATKLDELIRLFAE